MWEYSFLKKLQRATLLDKWTSAGDFQDFWLFSADTFRGTLRLASSANSVIVINLSIKTTSLQKDYCFRSSYDECFI